MTTTFQAEPRAADTGKRALFCALSLAIGAAIAARASIDFGSEVMPKVNPAYYLIQVRSLLETGQLAIRDFPLVFCLQALLARIFLLLKLSDLHGCVFLAARIFDSVAPALAAAPAFLLARRWALRRGRSAWPALVVAVFVLFYYPALVMTSDFQKNALGIVWFIGLVCALHQAVENRSWRAGAAVMLFFALAGITHVGTFGVTLAFVMLAGTTLLILTRRGSAAHLVKLGAVALGLVATLAALGWVTDAVRLGRLLGLFLYPAQLFKEPMLLTAIKGAAAGPTLLDVANLLLVHVLASGGAVMLIRRWPGLSPATRATVVSSLALCLFLASPLLGKEIAARFFMMAYAPAAVVLALVLTTLERRWLTGAVAGLMTLATVGSAALVWQPVRVTELPEGSLEELYAMQPCVKDPKTTLVLARHGLEWWAAWAWRTRVAEQYGITPRAWQRYKEVLFLRQVAGRNPRSPAGFSGLTFQDIEIPSDATVLFAGKYFVLAKVDRAPPDFPLARPR